MVAQTVDAGLDRAECPVHPERQLQTRRPEFKRDGSHDGPADRSKRELVVGERRRSTPADDAGDRNLHLGPGGGKPRD
jgi:hypothetical protein